MPPIFSDAKDAVQVVSIDPDTQEFTLNEDALKAILLSEDVANLPVVVVSVAGPFRLGKSFLLNFFLRYLEDDGAGDWLEEDFKLEPKQERGFGWAHGSERDTVGIWMWPRPLIRTLVDGTDVAVLLVDTQGTFDNKTPSSTNARVFAFNALISSFQVYNISKRIGEDQLQHMHMFTKFGQMAASQQTKSSDLKVPKPFQRLQFLVRDWNGKKDHAFGAAGGEDYLRKVLSVENTETSAELEEVRKDIKECFDTLSCYLLPHPGQEVDEGESVACGDMRKEFYILLKEFVPMVLKRENLTVKCMLGETVNCHSLYEYMKTYVAIFRNGNLPEVTNVYDATARGIKTTAFQSYQTGMRVYCGANAPYREPVQVKDKHLELKNEALEFYAETPRLDAPSVEKEMREKLVDEIEEEFTNLESSNASKALSTQMKTPITLVTLSFTSHIAGTIIDFIGVTFMAVLLGYCSWFSMLAAAFWFYNNQTGAFADETQEVDKVAKLVNDLFSNIMKQVALRKVVNASKKTQ